MPKTTWRRVRKIQVYALGFEGLLNPRTGKSIAVDHCAVLVVDDENAITGIIWHVEAFSIALYQGKETYPVVCLHDLWKMLCDLSRAELTVHRAEVYAKDPEQGVFQARLVIGRPGVEKEDIPCTLGDAINIALRFDAPIYVASHLLRGGEEKMADAMLARLSDDDTKH